MPQYLDPNLLFHTPPWLWVLFIAIILFQLAGGLLIALCVRPRDGWGDITAGGLTYLVAALTGFFIHAGPTTTWNYEAAVVGRDVNLVTSGIERDPNTWQEEILRKYPDLRGVEKKERGKALEGKIIADLYAGSFQGIWQGFLASLVGVPVGICMTVAAGHLLRRDQKRWRIVVPYLEVAVVALLWSVHISVFPSNPHLFRPLLRREILLFLLSSAWLALGIVGMLRGWRWWYRWLVHLAFIAAYIGANWAIMQMPLTDTGEL
jgi:hypothetical protein